MGRLQDKVAVITGGGSGMGRASCLAFAAEGARVVVVDRTIASGEETARAVSDDGGEAVFFEADVSDGADVPGWSPPPWTAGGGSTCSSTTPGSKARRSASWTTTRRSGTRSSPST